MRGVRATRPDRPRVQRDLGLGRLRAGVGWHARGSQGEGESQVDRPGLVESVLVPVSSSCVGSTPMVDYPHCARGLVATQLSVPGCRPWHSNQRVQVGFGSYAQGCESLHAVPGCALTSPGTNSTRPCEAPVLCLQSRAPGKPGSARGSMPWAETNAPEDAKDAEAGLMGG